MSEHTVPCSHTPLRVAKLIPGHRWKRLQWAHKHQTMDKAAMEEGGLACFLFHHVDSSVGISLTWGREGTRTHCGEKSSSPRQRGALGNAVDVNLTHTYQTLSQTMYVPSWKQFSILLCNLMFHEVNCLIQAKFHNYQIRHTSCSGDHPILAMIRS